jgi:hypothetical protein
MRTLTVRHLGPRRPRPEAHRPTGRHRHWVTSQLPTVIGDFRWPTVSPSWAYTLQLPHDPNAPGIARATLRTVLAAHGLTQLVPTAELLASEPLTDAHLHTRGPYALRARPTETGRLRVAVRDTDPRVPPGFADSGLPVALPPLDAEGGRGLHLGRARADSVGVSALQELGASKGGSCFGSSAGDVLPSPDRVSRKALPLVSRVAYVP